MAKKFADSILGAAPHQPALPVVHTTTTFAFDEHIAPQGKLAPQPCPVYTGEQLLYFFYGRPAFRPAGGDIPTGLEQLAPVCLVMRSDVAAKPARMMPFDSGAYEHGILDDHHSRAMKKEGFELPPMLESAQRIVGLYFGASNEAYYDVRGSLPPGGHQRNWYVESYGSMIDRRATNKADGRSSAVEIQLDHEVTLKGNVLAFVMPAPMWQDADVQALVKDWGAEPLTYRLTGLFKPSDLCHDIEGQIHTFLKESGLL